jgi:hypothetical protein
VDILAHTLWAGAGVVLARRRWPIAPRTAALTLLLAALPDVLPMLPLVGWWLFGDGTLAALRAAAIAVPGHEPALPALLQQWSWHLHCVMHSAVVAGAATLALALAVRARRRRFWIPLLGWWSHIAIDVFTHSAAYYPAPVLYPFSQRGFDGLAWNTPWFLGLNYVVLAAVSLALWLSRRR